MYSASVSDTGKSAVVRACRGVIFLGAAHTASRQETLGQIAAKCAAVVQPSFESETLKDLERHSPDFDRINDLFLKFVEEREEAFKTITFYEEEAIPVAGEVTVGYDSARMDGPHHQSHGLRTNHSDMCRFARHDDPNYILVSSVIRNFYEDAIRLQQAHFEVLYDSPDALIE